METPPPTGAGAAARPPPAEGSPAARCRVVSVRLTATEHHAWHTACRASPWGEVARWVREVIADAPAAPGRVWEVPALAEVGPEQLAEVRRQATALNELTRAAHRLGHLDPETVWLARAAAEAAAQIVTALLTPGSGHPRPPGVLPVPGARERRPRLVNVRLSPAEYQVWASAAAEDGWPRVSAWARGVVCARLGLPVQLPPPGVPPGLMAARRQVGGIVANLAQLVQVATITERPGDAVALEVAQEQTQHALDELYRVGVSSG